MKKVLMLVMLLCMGMIGSSLAGEMWQAKYSTPEGATPASGGFPADFTAVEDWLATQTPMTGWPQYVPNYEFPDDGTDWYCAQNIGWIISPVSGTFRFWIAGDDSQRLWLSSDSSALDCKTAPTIAGYDGWTGRDNWDWYPTQMSAPIELVAGRAYWTRAIHQDGTGGGHMRVAWQSPSMNQGPLNQGGATPVDIPSSALTAKTPTKWSQLVGDVTVNPSPANGGTGVTYPNATLTWEKAATITPALPSAISKYKLYLGKSVAVGDPADPNAETVYFKKEIAAASPLSYDATGLNSTTTYYWRVDTLLADGNVAYGRLWSFQTIVAVPVIQTQPVDLKVGVTCPGTFSVEALSGELDDGGPLTFTWKKQDGTVLKTETISDLGLKKSEYTTNIVGTYYVEVKNAAGAINSNQVTLSNLGHGVGALNVMAVGDGNSAGVGSSVSGGELTLIGSGSDIWNASDGFQYAYVEISGDFDVSCRLSSFSTTNTDGWSKAGIMCRDDTSGGATHVIMGSSSGNGMTMQGRRDTGTANNGNHTGAGGTGGAYPHGLAQTWYRMTRVGNVFTCYYSVDGSNWILYPASNTGGEEISNPWTRTTITDPVCIGLAVGAHAVGQLATAKFDNIKGFAFPTWKPSNPTYSFVTPEGWIDPTQDLTVGWTKSSDEPCNGSYNVYGGEAGSTLTLLGNVTTNSFTVPVAAGLLDFNKSYEWRVDVIAGTDSETGDVWKFDTVKQFPTIITQPAPLTVVKGGATANLNVTVKTATVPVLVPMVKYEWFKVGNAAPLLSAMPVGPDGDGNYTCPFAINNTQLANEGYYYCVITNTVGPTTTTQALVLTQRLMLHYQFETADITGTTVADKSASGFNGQLITPGGSTNPKYGLEDGGIGLGKAIYFYGPNDPNNAYVTTNKKPMELGISGNFPRSVSVWAKAYGFNNGGLYDTGAYADNQDFCLRTLDQTNVNRWRVQYWGGSDRDITADSFNKWVHFVHVFDGVNTQLYVNGVQVLNWATPLNTNNDNNFVIGRYQNDDQRFIGLLDDFRLYNYALTPQEAAQRYIEVKGGPVCYKALTGDLDGNCKVNILDFALFSAQWLTDTLIKP